MQYHDVPIAHVLNYYLYDAFKQSGEDDLRGWLGPKGKLAPGLFTDERRQEAFGYIHALGLDDLEVWMNFSADNPAVRLTLRNGAELVVCAVAGDGVAWISTPHFERDYTAYHSAAS